MSEQAIPPPHWKTTASFPVVPLDIQVATHRNWGWRHDWRYLWTPQNISIKPRGVVHLRRYGSSPGCGRARGVTARLDSNQIQSCHLPVRCHTCHHEISWMQETPVFLKDSGPKKESFTKDTRILKLTAKAPARLRHPIRKGSSSNHPCSGAMLKTWTNHTFKKTGITYPPILVWAIFHFFWLNCN